MREYGSGLKRDGELALSVAPTELCADVERADSRAVPRRSRRVFGWCCECEMKVLVSFGDWSGFWSARPLLIILALQFDSFKTPRPVKATRSRNCNLRIRPTDPGVATLSDFESVGPDRPTRCAERGGGILGRNDCFLAVSGGFERFQAVLDRHSPTDRPRSEKG